MVALNKDEAQPKLAGNFLSDDETAHRRGDDGGRAQGPEFVGKRRAEAFDDGHLLKREGALEKLPAMQAAAEDEMAFEQRAGLAEKLEGFFIRHGRA